MDKIERPCSARHHKTALAKIYHEMNVRLDRELYKITRQPHQTRVSAPYSLLATD